jgi:hypothetical protein
MSRFGQKGKELNPEDDSQFAIIGLFGLVPATAFAIGLAELNDDFTFTDQAITLAGFTLGLIAGYAYTQRANRVNKTEAVAHA